MLQLSAKARYSTVAGSPNKYSSGDTSIDWPDTWAGGHDVPTDVVSSEPLSSEP